MIGTLLRVDLPILGFIDKFVLYADVDIFFRKDLKLEHFGELPDYFLLGSEANGKHIKYRDGKWFGNAGVMLMNIPALAKTHQDFISFIFSESNLKRGLDFGKLGSVDQGSYNFFYQKRFKVQPWPLFNWKPYWRFEEKAHLLHFHGPKPGDYEAYQAKGIINDKVFTDLLKQCDFNDPENGCTRFMAEVRHCGGSCMQLGSAWESLMTHSRFDPSWTDMCLYSMSALPSPKS